MMPAKEMAMEIVKAMDSKKGLDIRLLHTADITVLEEYFVICTASSATSHHSDAAVKRNAPSTDPVIDPMPPITTMSRIS